MRSSAYPQHRCARDEYLADVVPIMGWTGLRLARPARDRIDFVCAIPGANNADHTLEYRRRDE